MKAQNCSLTSHPEPSKASLVFKSSKNTCFFFVLKRKVFDLKGFAFSVLMSANGNSINLVRLSVMQ